MNGRECLVVFLLWLVPAFFSSIIIHELGHLFFGKLAGYRLIYIRFMFVNLIKREGKIECSFSIRGPLGQCIMLPSDGKEMPEMLVLGGCLLNVGSAGLFILIVFLGILTVRQGGKPEYMTILILIENAAVNLAAGISNFWFGTETSDGRTYREIRKNPQNCRSYDNLMRVYACIISGNRLSELPGEMFLPRSVKSSLSAELLFYDCVRMLEVLESEEAPKEEYVRILERLRIVAGCRHKRIAYEAGELLKKQKDKIEK